MRRIYNRRNYAPATKHLIYERNKKGVYAARKRIDTRGKIYEYTSVKRKEYSIRGEYTIARIENARETK